MWLSGSNAKLFTIEMIPTSGGFGLLGGALVECSTENYVPKCRDCYKANVKRVPQYKKNPGDSLILDKKDLLSSILADHKWMKK
jgi:hypothetical protein